MSDDLLLAAAIEVRKRAYARYSEFPVGAALLAVDGRVFLGCNVENISYGLTICAERVALGSAIAAGARNFSAIAVASESTEPVMPCGACRQVLAEFNPKLRVVSTTLSLRKEETTLSILLPSAKQGVLG